MNTHDIYDELQAAIVAESVPRILSLLYTIAEHLAQQNEKEHAFNILALIIQYPMTASLRAQADGLYDDLEWQLCSRAVWDANERAFALTLEDMALELLHTRTA